MTTTETELMAMFARLAPERLDETNQRVDCSFTPNISATDK
ncbi:hypothetical protein [Vibrio spartinae]|uniref:Uncharacterized protein n=1 Tax=Vibrio spartinae TaxID=1918945 RepID=A0A1N6M8M1_9VIBR|nr:hypothetical protein [Vibrio spartinae]SIO95795.1 hypothetical protein VSP9026_03547 [Vibrio spartinae]